jgi:hypothetical protein
VAGGRLTLEPIEKRAEILFAEKALIGAGGEAIEQCFVAGQQSQVEQRGRHGEVALGERQGVGRAKDLVAHRERRVPKRIEDRFGQRPGFLRLHQVGIDE